MKMQNFTLAGRRVTVVARVGNGKPLFDLDIGTETILEGVPYNYLIDFCKGLQSELGEVTIYWDAAGKELANFNSQWMPTKEVEPE